MDWEKERREGEEEGKKEEGRSTSDWLNSGWRQPRCDAEKEEEGKYLWRVVRRIGEGTSGMGLRGVNDLSRVVSWLGFGNVLKRFTT